MNTPFDPSAVTAWDSRDLIARTDELQGILDAHTDEGTTMDPDDAQELAYLKELTAEFDCSPDWHHGEQVIHDDYFTQYIEELIDDCYEVPKSSEWPYRHMTMDYEAAADEARQDYMECTIDGYTFLIRA